METAPPRSLLVLKPSSFGDIVHTLPAVARLKAVWPDCRISWLANTEWMPLLDGNPDVAEVVGFPRNRFRGWRGVWRMAKWLRAEIAGRRPDLVLDFQGLLRSALIGRATGTRNMAGLSDAREGACWFYHRTARSPRQPIHAIERYLTLADAELARYESGGRAPEKTGLKFSLPPGEPVALPFATADDFVLLHPFSRGNDKSLSASKIEELLRKIRRARVVIAGRGESAVLTDPERCVNLLNQTTLAQLIWLTRRASFVISVDSGPAHLAAALGKPMVAIHSWTNPRKVGPYHADAWVWKNRRLTRVRDLHKMTADFFEPRPLDLRDADLEAIARLATSSSDSSA